MRVTIVSAMRARACPPGTVVRRRLAPWMPLLDIRRSTRPRPTVSSARSSVFQIRREPYASELAFVQLADPGDSRSSSTARAQRSPLARWKSTPNGRARCR